ncbi:MAG: hypothetical protein M1474_03505 [Candidatus Marsarchaeota archaeon]|jgi:methionine--tRNA ligase beta chain|nr:hypothetical protein [Candidatus Marsarchaeota archaeon]
MVSKEEFSAIDLRVGRIKSVEDAGTKKPMYKISVDVGELGTRTVIAGIKSYYAPEELVDKEVIIVVNLEPKAIAGTMSEGMLLAAEDGSNVSLLVPDRRVAEGSKVL